MSKPIADIDRFMAEGAEEDQRAQMRLEAPLSRYVNPDYVPIEKRWRGLIIKAQRRKGIEHDQL